MSRIRLVIVDDQPLFRAGTRMLLDSQHDLTCLGEAGDGRQARQVVERLRPDVVLLDVRMPGIDGIETTARIIEDAHEGSRRPPRIIMLTTFDLDDNVARAIRAGASGFVLKDAAPEFLLATIRTVYAGNAVIAASATRALLAHESRPHTEPAPPQWAALTPRERHVFELAAQGMSNAEIAAREYVSEATVKTHISRILGKLGLRDRVQLVVFAHRHRLSE